MKKKLLLGLSLAILSGGGQHLSASEVENDVPQTRAVACSWSGSAGKNTDGTNTCKTSSGKKVETRTWQNGHIVQKVVYDTRINKWDYRYNYSSTNGNRKLYQDWNNGLIIQENVYNPSTDRVNEKTFWTSTKSYKTKYETWSYGTLDTRTTYYSNGNRNIHNIYENGKTIIQQNTYLKDIVDTKNFYTTTGVRTKYEDWEDSHRIQVNNYSNGKVTDKTFWNTKGTKTRYEIWSSGNKEQVDYYTAGKIAYTDYYTNGKRTSRKSFETFKPQLNKYNLICKYGNICYYGHNGTDIQSLQPAYTTTNSYNKVTAVASGKVVDTGSGCPLSYREDANCNFGMGNYVTLNHGDGRKTIYMHLQGPKVNVGDYIVQGEYLGTEGASGDVKGSTGIHSHISYLVNDVYKNPENVISYKSEQRSAITEANEERIEENIDYEGYLEYLKQIEQNEENNEI